MKRNQSPQRNKAQATRFLILPVILLVALMALTILLSQPPSPSSITPESSLTDVPGSNISDGIRIYFTEPGSRGAGMDARLVEQIDSAGESVLAAVLALDLESVAEALIRAQARGVTVQVVIDSDYREEAALLAVKRAGIPVVEDGRKPLMHNKFVVIDGKLVVTGSWNLTTSETFRNNNNILFITSRELAASYTAEFNEMFAGGQFGSDSPSETPNPLVTVDGVRIEVYFAPEDDVYSHLLPVVRGAQKSIHFLVFAFTYDDLAQIMVDKHNAGLTVRGVFEQRNVDAAGAVYPFLRRSNVDVLSDGNPYNLHHKVIIVDEEIVITGSFNFTKAAQTSNDENLLILHSPEIARLYLAEFEKLYQQAGGAQ